MRSLNAPLSRVDYFKLGLSLMALKYAGDMLFVYLALERLWTPGDYVAALLYSPTEVLGSAPTWLLSVLGVWLLPFLLVGVHLTMRRAIDAGWTPWIAIGFFAPVVNYGLMALLCLVPSARATAGPDQPPRPVRPAEAADWLMPVSVGAGIGIALMFVAVYALRSYATALFLGTPFVVGTVAGFLMARQRPSDDRSGSKRAGVAAIGVIGLAGIITGFEGLVCLLMSLPLSLPLALFGAVAGSSIAERRQSPLRPMILGVAMLPIAMAVEPNPGTHPMAREVLTSIEIGAPPAAVWPMVLAFPAMPEPSDLMFRLGIAYPRAARIVGTGVGAVRYCEFSTGAFVEPITAWEPGPRLAFDVTESPEPLREWSPYAHVRAPHLDGFLRSRRGEFRLVPLEGGRTRLEGRTWYEVHMAPEWYWRVFADAIIHRIHARVLEHIRDEVVRTPNR